MSIIEIKNLGKKYNISHQKGGYVALRDVMANVFKNPFKFIFHKTRQITGREKKEEFWALKDINFTVKKGEVIGIIGHNGAGKSTLLKILSEITTPTTGEVIINGSVGSLLEVGTGFHPELTGRENIMLNGAILGMTKKEIENKFNQIVKFADIDKFLDTPVKRYSSGMYVRLAFSVAAHMDPDILIVDEVLAVGDAEFQKKCLGKMDEITKKEGRTILFVSHNMSAIKQLCQKCILLENGEIKMVGNTDTIVGEYLSSAKTKIESEHLFSSTKRARNNEVELVAIRLINNEGKKNNILEIDKDLSIEVEYNILKDIKNFILGIRIVNQEGVVIFSSCDTDANHNLKDRIKGSYKNKCLIPKNLLNEGSFFVDIYGDVPGIRSIINLKNIIQFTAIKGRDNFGYGIRPGAIKPLLCWEIIKKK